MINFGWDTQPATVLTQYDAFLEKKEEVIQNTRVDVRVPFVIPFRRDLLKLTKVQFYF
jgi:hypothetical protein